MEEPFMDEEAPTGGVIVWMLGSLGAFWAFLVFAFIWALMPELF